MPTSVTCLYMVSYDVASLFTNIPLSETIDLAVNAIFESSTGLDLKLSKTELKELFNFATSHTHFLFNGCFYDQVDGVAMGSPLAPVLANFFMGHYEKLWLNNYTGPKVLYYRRYVDDIICCFKALLMPVCFLSTLILAIPTLSSLWKQRIRVSCHFKMYCYLSKVPMITRALLSLLFIVKRLTLVYSLIILALPHQIQIRVN